MKPVSLGYSQLLSHPQANERHQATNPRLLIAALTFQYCKEVKSTEIQRWLGKKFADILSLPVPTVELLRTRTAKKRKQS